MEENVEENQPDFPLDIKIITVVFMICIPVMLVCTGVGIYQKIMEPEPKDWRDGYQEYQQTMNNLRSKR